MAPDGSRLLGEGKIVFHEPEKHPTLEGPKFLKKDGWYYILAPAGGVETGWQVVLRSKNIHGPYEDKIVLAQGDTDINGPHQGALVDTPKGEWWFIHFQDAGIYGRIVHLQPVSWRDGWPLMGQINDHACGCGEPVMNCRKPATNSPALIAVPQTSDEFDSLELGPQWQWNANHNDAWHSLSARKGWLRLYSQLTAHENLLLFPSLLLQKFPAREFSAETSFDLTAVHQNEEAGLIVAGQSSAALAFIKTDSRCQIVLRINGVQEFACDHVSQNVKLRVAVNDGGRCTFSFSSHEDWVPVPLPFSAQKGVWIGARLGIYSLSRHPTLPAGHVDVDYFRLS